MSVRMTAPHPTINSPLSGGERQHIAKLPVVRDHISKNYRAGERLPVVKGAYCGTAKAMAVRVGLPMLHVATPLKALSSAGEIYLCAGSHGPECSAARIYTPTTSPSTRQSATASAAATTPSARPCPRVCWAAEFGQEPDQMARALRHLVRDELVRHDSSGPYGPGYYVTPEASGPLHANRAPHPMPAAGARS
ncbi:hypothetical protein [Streptomyces sp. NPDC085665]|uniref:hypothetical protein n=1 Tax=Streptomyces sp. NPDC085665 TaxID=3365735 RepID=UPI0037CD26AC